MEAVTRSNTKESGAESLTTSLCGYDLLASRAAAMATAFVRFATIRLSANLDHAVRAHHEDAAAVDAGAGLLMTGRAGRSHAARVCSNTGG